jgi:hypothetical protein
MFADGIPWNSAYYLIFAHIRTYSLFNFSPPPPSLVMVVAITVVDFMNYNLGVGQALDYEAAKKDMLSRIDENSDGRLDFNEFFKLFEKVYVKSKRALAGITLDAEPEA